MITKMILFIYFKDYLILSMFDSPTPKAYKANPNYSRFLQNFIKESVKIKAPKRTRVQSAMNDTSRAMQTDRRSFTPSNRS